MWFSGHFDTFKNLSLLPVCSYQGCSSYSEKTRAPQTEAKNSWYKSVSSSRWYLHSAEGWSTRTVICLLDSVSPCWKQSMLEPTVRLCCHSQSWGLVLKGSRGRTAPLAPRGEGQTHHAGSGEAGRDITQMERRNLDILVEGKTDGQVSLLLSLLPLSVPRNRQLKTF